MSPDNYGRMTKDEMGSLADVLYPPPRFTPGQVVRRAGWPRCRVVAWSTGWISVVVIRRDGCADQRYSGGMSMSDTEWEVER